MAFSAGSVSILSVGEGHIRLTFDSADEIERIRAGRIVKDMLRRGYALLIATPGVDGQTKWSRAKEFDEATSEYIIADYAPEDADDHRPDDGIAASDEVAVRPPAGRPRGRPRRVPAASAEAVAVGRTAGG